MNKITKEINRIIKKYDNIVIARHIGADPDALGSQFAMKELISYNYPNKRVYAVGSVASRFRFMGRLDHVDGIDLSNYLLIVVDTPDIKRIDDANPSDYGCVIKIDHHPFVEHYGNIEFVEENSSSSSQLIFKFILDNKLKINEKIVSNLYIGIVSDTDRFLHDYTNIETFELTTKLLNMCPIDFTKLYKSLYARPISEVRFQGYIYDNLILTDNNVAYIKLTDDIMKKYGVDPPAAGNMINDLKFVNEILVWVFFSEDKKSNLVRANIRSCGPEIKDVAIKYGGGGHVYASGVRLSNFDSVNDIINDLEQLVIEYKKKSGN